MDKLFVEAIRAYSLLEDTSYKFKFGFLKNGKIISGSEHEIELKFQSENFFHLFGFQYLENLDENTVNKKVMFKSFRNLVYKELPLSQNRYYEQITRSPSFSQTKIQNRLNIIKNLPYLLDRFSKKNTYWKYENFKGVVTDITWDYLIILASEESITSQENYLFIRKSTEDEYLVPVSVFSQNPFDDNYKDYKQNQVRYDISAITKYIFE